MVARSTSAEPQKLENDLKTLKGVEEAYWVISSDMRQWFQPSMSESGQRSCERMEAERMVRGRMK
ncbi:hypothetical protein VCV18_011879 [Metarhizium anisopliae]